MKEGKRNKILGLFFIFLGIVFIGISLFMTFTKPKENKESKKEEQKEEKKDEKKEEKTVTVILSPKEQEALLNKLPIATSIYAADADKYSVFQDKAVSVNDMDKNWILVNAISSIKEEERDACKAGDSDKNGLCDFTVSTEKVSEIINNNYEDKEFSLIKTVQSNLTFKCTLDKNRYICSNTGGGTITDEYDQYFKYNSSTSAVYSYIKTNKDKNYTYVYYKYAFVDFTLEDDTAKSFKLYTSSDKTKAISDDIDAKKYFDSQSKKSFDERIIDEYGSKMQEYKITFKVEDKDYKLVAVEPVK